MADRPLDDFADALATETGLVTVATQRASGRPLLSVVNAGLVDHPVDAHRVAAFATRGTAAKLTHLRARPWAVMTARRGWDWVGVEGPAELIGPDDPHPDVTPDDVRLLIRAIFRAAGGTHDDFDEFDRVMAAERRCAVLITPERTYGRG